MIAGSENKDSREMAKILGSSYDQERFGAIV